VEWEKALDLPENEEAPACLRSHVADELRILFHIGRKKTLSDSEFNKLIGAEKSFFVVPDCSGLSHIHQGMMCHPRHTTR